MNWTLVDSSGFAELRLGDEKAAVRERLGEHRTFRRTPEAPPTDQFTTAGAMVTYDADDRVILIEVTPPAEPLLVGVPLLDRPLTTVMQELRAHGLNVVEDRDGALVHGWGVGLYAVDETVEGVSIGE